MRIIINKDFNIFESANVCENTLADVIYNINENINYVHVTNASPTNGDYKIGVEEKKINLPDINIGDEIKIGKFKNKTAKIEDYFIDTKNQPKIKTNKGDKKVFNFNINENIDEDVTPNQINLNSFKSKNELNPLFFPNNKLNSKVRLRLLDIADDFFDTLELPWVKLSDVLLVGSLCTYNWSKYSDIDLHLIVNFKEINEDIEMVEKYLMSKKSEWNDLHENLKIYGFPVEVYVEDISREDKNNGIYSIHKNEWIKKPTEMKSIGLDKYYIKNYASKLMNKIDSLEEKFEANEFDNKLTTTVGSLWNRIKGLRRTGIDRDGETAWENIVFKILRRSLYLERLFNLKIKTYDKEKSIDRK